MGHPSTSAVALLLVLPSINKASTAALSSSPSFHKTVVRRPPNYQDPNHGRQFKRSHGCESRDGSCHHFPAKMATKDSFAQLLSRVSRTMKTMNHPFPTTGWWWHSSSKLRVPIRGDWRQFLTTKKRPTNNQAKPSQDMGFGHREYP